MNVLLVYVNNESVKTLLVTTSVLVVKGTNKDHPEDVRVSNNVNVIRVFAKKIWLQMQLLN